MSVMGQYGRLKATCTVDLQPVLTWTCLREHVIGLMSMDVYVSASGPIPLYTAAV